MFVRIRADLTLTGNIFKKGYITKEAEDIARKQGKRVASRMNAIVGNWSKRPVIRTNVYTSSNSVQAYTRPVGANKIYWEWTSRGTKPHKISARRAPALVFPANYSPRTKPGGVFGGPGTKSGPIIRAGSVNHPGTEARKFEEHIIEDENLLDTLTDEIVAAIIKGL